MIASISKNLVSNWEVFSAGSRVDAIIYLNVRTEFGSVSGLRVEDSYGTEDTLRTGTPKLFIEGHGEIKAWAATVFDGLRLLRATGSSFDMFHQCAHRTAGDIQKRRGVDAGPKYQRDHDAGDRELARPEVADCGDISARRAEEGALVVPEKIACAQDHTEHGHRGEPPVA